RVYQAVKLYLFSPSSGLYSCPLAMTDGAAKTLEEIRPNGVMLKTAYKHLTTRNPGHFWTSGQWMTERQGGSDVGVFICLFAICFFFYARLLGGINLINSEEQANNLITQQPSQPTGQQPNQPTGQQPSDTTGQQPNEPTGQQPNDPTGQQPNQPTGQ
ncbi:predicted protein, partial [Nematostella vectensis]